MDIGEVLDRRSDLSTFVVHLTRDEAGGKSAKQRLESIIGDRHLLAGTPMGWAQSLPSGPSHPDVAGVTQRVVCFSETPLEHIYSMFADIAGRGVKLQPYGLAFTKMTARRKGANPIWYVDRTAGAEHQWVTAKALDALGEEALQPGSSAVRGNIAKLLPFFDVMGTWPESQKEFWWEREWRHVGDMKFELSEAALWLCPEGETDYFAQLLGGSPVAQRIVDPSWGLERIIAKLAELKKEDVTPFGTR